MWIIKIIINLKKYMKIKVMMNFIKNILFNKNKIVPFTNIKLEEIEYKINNIIILEDDELEYILLQEKEDLKKIIITYNKSINDIIKIINNIYIH